MEYTRLSPTEREQIMVQQSQGKTATAIARTLGRSVSTITREIERHTPPEGQYSALRAQRTAELAASLHRGPRKLDSPPLWHVVEEKLNLRWSPEQIARYLRRTYPDDTAMHVSHETIYGYLYVQSRGQFKKELVRCLRQHRPSRRSKNGKGDDRGKILDMVSIHERPAEVADRSVPGHWEGDLIMGASNRSALGTLVERKTRFVILVRLTAHDAETVRKSFARDIRHLPEYLRKSMTYDQGKEMAGHVTFTLETKMQVYFADPHSPWMRGSNENTNGLVRDFFPKGTDFSNVPAREIRFVQDALNERPRKTLEWRTPKEAFEEVLENHASEITSR